MKEKLGVAALLVTSVLVTLVAVEVALRVMDKFPPPPQEVRTRRPDLYVADPDVGYRMHASLETSYRYPPERPDPIPLRSNSEGFRTDHEFDREDVHPGVLVVGDSFVFGEGVRAEERLTEVLASMEPGWRVDNLGMPGWGVDLMIRALEKYVEEIDPEVVVLGVYTDDFRRLLRYYRGAGFRYPKFALERGRLVTVSNDRIGPLEGTRLAQAWTRWYWARNRNRFDLNEALLERFVENAERYDFVPVVAYIPGRGENEEDRERRTFLENWAAQQDVAYVDLSPPLFAAGIENVYIEDNWHWNPEGHRIAAEELHTVISQLLPATDGMGLEAR